MFVKVFFLVTIQSAQFPNRNFKFKKIISFQTISAKGNGKYLFNPHLYSSD